MINIFDANVIIKKNWAMYFTTLFYCILSLIVSIPIFGYQSSLVIPFLISLSVMPVFVNLFENEAKEGIIEERKKLFEKLIKLEDKEKYEKIKKRLKEKQISLIKLHWDVAKVFFYFFLAILTFYIASYFLLPEDIKNCLFNEQEKLVKISGGFNLQENILLHNLTIFAFILAFSLFYSAGSVFILSWNTSVLAYTISKAIEIYGIKGFFYYFIHGSIEIFSYFLVSLASGIITISVIKGIKSKEEIVAIVKDFLILFVAGIISLIIAYLIEIS